MKSKRSFLIITVLLMMLLACNVLTSPYAPSPTESNSPSTEMVKEFTPASLAGLVYGVYNRETNERTLWQIGEGGTSSILLLDYNYVTFSPNGKQAIYTKFPFAGDGPECTWLADFVINELRPLDCVKFNEQDMRAPNYVLGWISNEPNTVFALLNSGWSPMGGYQGYLGTISLSDGVVKVLDSKNEISVDVEISPDGKAFAYNHGIYSFESGYQDFDITQYGITEPYIPSNPSWSPDGKKIAWGLLHETEHPNQVTFGVFDLTDKTANILFSPFIPQEAGEYYTPQVPYGIWSPDSQWLAISSEAKTEDEIYDPENSGWRIVNINGQVKHKLDGQFDSWSPDSQWIAYVTRGENDVNILELRVAHPDGIEMTKLGEVEDFYLSKLWSADGRYLVFIDSNNTIQLAEVGTWQIHDITEHFKTIEPSAEFNLVDWISPMDTSFESMTTLPTPTAQPIFSCPNAPKTRLKVGDIARITYTDGSTTRLRSAPEAGDNKVDDLPEGTEFEIIGGPVCYPRPERNDSYVYWEISVPSRNVQGWVAEGDFDGYYIEPWQ